MRIAVLGAGVIGVTTAWYLARAGHDVIVVDRQLGPALETSHANGGQISVSHAEPWANPGAWKRIVKWLGQEDSPLLWRLRADMAQWAWGWEFLRECSPARTQANIKALVTLGLLSRLQLQSVREELGLTYDQELRGILHIYTDEVEFSNACRQAEFMRKFGCERQPVSVSEVLKIEPALVNSRAKLCGGTFTAQDESGDAHLFVQQLCFAAAQVGVNFRFGCDIKRLAVRDGLIKGVELVNGEAIATDSYVVACGSYSTPLLQTIGIRIPVYPAKGYSATFHGLEGEQNLPKVSLTDDARKLVFSRLGDRLRVAGTAEFTGFNTALNVTRCAAIIRRAEELFPALTTASQIDYWTGLRPSTPGNVPLVGKTCLENLWLNTGHGTLGWTLACGSAKLLTQLIDGVLPSVSPDPYSPLSYRR